MTPARPGLFVATARVREEHGRGFPRERGRRSGDGCRDRARRAREKGREREKGRWDGVEGGRREKEREERCGGNVSDDEGGRGWGR